MARNMNTPPMVGGFKCSTSKIRESTKYYLFSLCTRQLCNNMHTLISEATAQFNFMYCAYVIQISDQRKETK